MTKKVFVITLLFMLIVSIGYAADWSKYESGRNNIRLEGYQGQPGYIAFYDSDGSVAGYLWWSKNRDRLVVCTDSAIDLTTTKLTDHYGVDLY